MTDETVPLPPTIEEQTLAKLGYGNFLDKPVFDTDITGRHFLDVYQNPIAREQTRLKLLGFVALDPSDPGYNEARDYILTRVEGVFGPLPVE